MRLHFLVITAIFLVSFGLTKSFSSPFFLLAKEDTSKKPLGDGVPDYKDK